VGVGVWWCESGAVDASKWGREVQGRAKGLGEECWGTSRDRDELVMAGCAVDEGTGDGDAGQCSAVRSYAALRRECLRRDWGRWVERRCVGVMRVSRRWHVREGDCDRAGVGHEDEGEGGER
jgi:hypothetical protein